MVQRLSDKNLVKYEKYKGVTLTQKGENLAKKMVRKHRLWEYFLEEKLGFKWDEVHEIAEQLEHIDSSLLVERLDEFLGHPRYDPHGDPIPDENGNIYYKSEVLLADLDKDDKGVIVGVKEHSPQFLQYLDKVNLVIGAEIRVVSHFEYDNSLVIEVDDKEEQTISHQVCKNLYIKPLKEKVAQDQD
jgi:DtxR family Mn-dependent transcriptional regulator